MRIQNLLNTKRFYLTDGGLETFMIFEKGHELPCFSAATLLDSESGKQDLVNYYERFINIARQSGRGYIMDAPTWRAGIAWANSLGQSEQEALDMNGRAVSFISKIRTQHETATLPILLNGLVGPAGDAYAPDTYLNIDEAFKTHAPQIRALGKSGVDLISAMTLTYAKEAIAITNAAKEIDIPIVIAFTLETDGKLPSGQPLKEAIYEVDEATHNGPLYYMINCAHPEHFRSVLEPTDTWIERIGGIRANASRMSHAELDQAVELDPGDPVELASLNHELLEILPNICVIGGCCGTDHRHVSCIAKVS